MKNLFLLSISLLLSFSVFSQTARVQVIHNSPDALAAEVDVYVNSDLTLDDFAFRTATPFVDLPAGTEIELSVAPANSSDVGDAVLTVPVTLTEDETYIVVADGIVSPTGYNPAPPLTLQVFAMGREAASNGANTDVLVHHGSTDAPTVDVFETGAGAGLIVDDISYSEFQGYLELPTADYVIQVNDATGTTGVAAYEAPLSTLGLDGAAITVLASGFLDPTQNSDGPAFGLYVALPAGGPLVALPGATLGVNDVNSAAISIFPNPVKNQLTIAGIELANFDVNIYDVQGRLVIDNSSNINGDQIDTSSLSSGMYLLRVTNGNEISKTIRFVKQ
ncbi:DUF4397 domain-containing protein [Marixanthomonas sp. SCSIO 43207]|uniref:T9SS type A sorting domain-containing protein n=1 Tax=Marixanthomonas sp. SCSIO 43207 TaxID=2779360 RepID=UPI001CA9392E|nr:DUF4397 domain-containing protein [Marixanthomonas sp. SCSIO 43207]UAB80373.1 DUF4397 domain-containing protein [Marixanthomonas sp. SCSIO 43207]